MHMYKHSFYNRHRGSAGAIAIAVMAALILIASTIYFMNRPVQQPADMIGNESADPAMVADQTGQQNMNADVATDPTLNDKMMDSGESMMAAPPSYTGTILAGSTSPVIDFNEADFDQAVQSDKLVVLYFYADWCPICKKEVQSAFLPAFDSLNEPDVVAFRVNYRDNFTDPVESALAREHGIAYQHTKVFLKNGKRVLKSPESWDRGRYLSEIASAK